MGVRSGVVLMGVLLGITSVSTTAATFEVPRNFEIMYVDLESTSKLGGDFKAELEPGKRQLVVRYNDRIGGGADADRFQSEPIILDITVAQDDEILLEAPHLFRKNDAAKFAESPEFTLIHKDSGEALNYDMHMLPTQPGVQMFRDYKDEIRAFTQTYQAPSVTAKAADKEQAKTEALDMLKLWYNRASAEDQKAFQEWMTGTQ